MTSASARGSGLVTPSADVLNVSPHSPVRGGCGMLMMANGKIQEVKDEENTNCCILGLDG